MRALLTLGTFCACFAVGAALGFALSPGAAEPPDLETRDAWVTETAEKLMERADEQL